MATSSLARQNMLKSQILTGNIVSEPVLAALEAVSRETFVPDSLRGVAYVDEEVPLGNNRYLMEPLAFARLLNQGAIEPRDTVLIIGTNSGYSAAVASRLARQVIAVEQDEALLAKAAKNLSGYANIVLHKGDLTQGEHTHAPYDVVLIEGAVEYVPQALAQQVKEGGRMVTFEREASPRIGINGLCCLTEYKKLHQVLFRNPMGNASVPLLPGFAKASGFAF